MNKSNLSIRTKTLNEFFRCSWETNNLLFAVTMNERKGKREEAEKKREGKTLNQCVCIAADTSQIRGTIKVENGGNRVKEQTRKEKVRGLRFTAGSERGIETQHTVDTLTMPALLTGKESRAAAQKRLAV